MTQTEALRMALEALERYSGIDQRACDAEDAIQEALAQQLVSNPDEFKCPYCYDHGVPPPECNTEAEKTAFAFGWWKALEANRAQPGQEPVAWSYWQSCLNDDGTQTAPWVHRLSKFKPNESIINKEIVPLYTTPPQRKPLTDEEIYRLCRNEGDEHSTCFIFNKDGTWSVLTLARAIEAAHGIKGESK